MKLAISGLGKMGLQIATKLVNDGHSVVGHDIVAAQVDDGTHKGIIPAYTEQAVINTFDHEPIVLWIMIPAAYIDSALATWASILPAGSIIIDGGNSDFRQDSTRSAKLAERGITLIDIGTSGGIWGIDNGFAMMVGGTEAAYTTIIPLLDTLSHPRGGHHFFGPSGAGHYVKMVHNAIEYGMMEALAEGYTMLKHGPYENINLAAAGTVWQQSSVIESWLNDLARQVLVDNPELNGIDGVVAESGEARWALETATEYGQTLPVVQASLDVRLASNDGAVDFHTKLLAALRTKFGGHNIAGK